MRFAVTVGICAATVAVVSATVPTIRLMNAADEGVDMPWIGLGTGGYAGSPTHGNATNYPECWYSTPCVSAVKQAVADWFEVGGRRLDCANSYRNQPSVGDAIAAATIPRDEMFILTKVGPSLPLGYKDALAQGKQDLIDLQVTQVDAMLIHWPFQNPSQGNVSHNVTHSQDPACVMNTPAFNGTKCRLDTWRALVQLWHGGATRSIGVSNYYVADLEEIKASGLPLPALNQIPFHLYMSRQQADTIQWCRDHNVTVLGYSPLGIPDWHQFPTSSGMAAKQLDDSVLTEIASKHGRSAAATTLAWQRQRGIPFNPRSYDRNHMQDNLGSFDLTLSADELASLDSRPQATCTLDPHFYECSTTVR